MDINEPIVLLVFAGAKLFAMLSRTLARLLDQIGAVAFTWALDVILSGGLGFLVARTILGMELIPSIVIGVALTATSVGLAVSVWEEHGSEDSRSGRYFLGIAGLDDLSAVVLMAILFAVAPVIRGQ